MSRQARSPARGAGALALWLGCAAWLGCPVKPLPGDLPMGQYEMSATGGVRGEACELDEVTGDDFTFTTTLTRESSSERAWVTLNGYSREGTFDGQVLTSQAEASRVFVACSECSTRVVETLTVAVLSRTQLAAAQGQCPADALDGGVAAPNPDAGLSGPGLTPQGYDAVRLCGALTTLVVADGLVDGGACEPKCGGCMVRYQLRGDRR